jgi:hypothetical protein
VVGLRLKQLLVSGIQTFGEICKDHKEQQQIDHKCKHSAQNAQLKMNLKVAKRKAKVAQAKVKAIANRTAAVSNMTSVLLRANILSVMALYNKLGKINKAKEYLNIYEASLAAVCVARDKDIELHKNDLHKSESDKSDSSKEIETKMIPLP